jgi:hypothetical protein
VLVVFTMKGGYEARVVCGSILNNGNNRRALEGGKLSGSENSRGFGGSGKIHASNEEDVGAQGVQGSCIDVREHPSRQAGTIDPSR